MTSTPMRLAIAGAAILTLTGAAPDDFDVRTQIGPHPVLPEPQQYLMPPMHLAPVVGWKAGETPKVASDMRIQALATGLEHPRSVYTLPNGDVLVVESRQPEHRAGQAPEKHRHELDRVDCNLQRAEQGQQPHHAAA